MSLIKSIGLLAGLLLVASCASTRASFPTKSLGSPYPNPKIVSGLLFAPEGEGPFPAVVLLHTCGGLRSHVTEVWPAFLTGLGYVVLAVDSYGPRGVSSCTQLAGDKLYQAEDAFGALQYLAGLPSVNAARIGVMGFSTGAIAINSHIVNATKRPPDGAAFKAAIAMYGLCSYISDYDPRRIALMEIAAEKDVKHAPSCGYAKKRFPDIEVHILPGAHHAFDQPRAGSSYDSGGSLMQYSGSATARARELTKAFLAKHL